ncbi:acyl transferase/acyl hydrolase/lysophospholipase [Powellomyces hirtus]|nr:acyl transferase/acyl hydrolase/lysophospholipase [Powellomyces hirtus]
MSALVSAPSAYYPVDSFSPAPTSWKSPPHSTQVVTSKMLRYQHCRAKLFSATRSLTPRSLNAWTAAAARKTAVLFPGQGAQHVGMGADIYEAYEAARDVIDEADEAVGGRLKKLMFEGPQQVLTSTENAQPAILCHSIALLKVLEKEYDFDIKSCTYALGHSLGEYSALVATKSLTLPEALKLVKLRGELMNKSIDNSGTTMKALIISGDHLEDIENVMSKIQRSLPKGEVAEIANINSRSQVVISGTVQGVEYACSIIQTRGYAGRALSLPVSAPFHCSLMGPAANDMKPALESAQFAEPSTEVISNVTGKPFNRASEIPSLLYEQITKTVQWQRSTRFASDDDVHDWVVIGPSRVLANLLRKEYPTDVITAISTVDDILQHGDQLSSCSRKRATKL